MAAQLSNLIMLHFIIVGVYYGFRSDPINKKFALKIGLHFFLIYLILGLIIVIRPTIIDPRW